MKSRYIFVFPTEAINKPLTYHLIKDFDLKVNIFNAYINSGEEGNLAVEIEGSSGQIRDGLEYAKDLGVECSTLEKRVSFNHDECINCGACVAVCYSGALQMDAGTMELNFDKDKCTVCELCTTACPLQLFKINFVE